MNALSRFDVLPQTSSAIVADALDKLGCRDQALDPAIRPLWPNARVVGRAFPIVISATDEEPALPYEGEMSAIDALGEGDVPVFAVEPGLRVASWGELFSCAARGRGARGAIVDGCVRDARQIEELGFPTFARCFSPLDTFGRAVASAWGVTTTVGGVVVDPGDLVVADVDGAVVIPAAIGDEVADAVAAKSALEESARNDLLSGKGVREVWDAYGVF